MLYDKMHYVCTLIGFGCYHQQHLSLLEERCTDEVTINNTLVFEGKTNGYHIAVGLFSYRLNKKASKCGKSIGDTLSWASNDTLSWASCATFSFLPCFNIYLRSVRTAIWNVKKSSNDWWLTWEWRCCKPLVHEQM